MCVLLLPPDVKPIAVKYIISYHLSCFIVSDHMIYVKRRLHWIHLWFTRVMETVTCLISRHNTKYTQEFISCCFKYWLSVYRGLMLDTNQISICISGARRWWVVSTTPRPLYSREKPGTHCTGGWLGTRAGLGVCEKSRPYRDSIPEPSSP
jgi:hypothetical protein